VKVSGHIEEAAYISEFIDVEGGLGIGVLV